jgi:uncharacterized protein YegP (UPF0339 family)
MTTHPNVEFYKGDDGDWRWRVQAANGEIVATGEGFTRRRDAKRGFEDMASTVRRAWLRNLGSARAQQPKEKES